MDIEPIKESIGELDGLSNTLGMEFLSTPDPDTCKARMKVDRLNRQPFGFLSGGATLALAENLAGVGSMALCPDKICVGINVSGNHVHAVREGETVEALATLQSKGRKLHVWRVDVTDSEGHLVSTVQVTNYVVSPKKDSEGTHAHESAPSAHDHD